ncbi:MAG: zinc-ribbon domain-containing protein [Thermoplasmatales archaeon]|nr:zinc-ribbon domain-containing protein [Thermoplasmatales archaeon]
MMKSCPRCKRVVSPRDKTCPYCGKELEYLF